MKKFQNAIMIPHAYLKINIFGQYMNMHILYTLLLYHFNRFSMRQRMPNISTGRYPYNCCACFLVCNANEVILHLDKKKQIKIKKTNKIKKRFNTRNIREKKHQNNTTTLTKPQKPIPKKAKI